MGSRYGGLKQMEAVGPGGETIIDYSVYDAMRAGFGKLVFVLRREMERTFREMAGRRFEERAAVKYIFQELDRLPAGYSVPAGRTKPWGTAHAILSAAGAIDEPFAAINADDFYGAAGYRALAEHLSAGTGDYAMVGFVLRNTLSEFGAVARGVCRVSGDGYLEDVVELTKIERDGAHARNTSAEGRVTRLSGDEVVSMNMWGFTPQVFADLEERFREFLARHGADARAEYYIPSAVNELVATGLARVKVLPTSDSWFGVTYREDRARVVESIGSMIREGYYPERLWT
ncbi:MAG: nucleotidyltransferase [Acidobacteriota bacterium]|nr:nucleotidyltransferase [Acidobacteriota bacterium]